MASEDYKRSQANARVLADVQRRLEALERGAPLRNGGVGAGGITVKGGTIRVLQGGNIEVDGAASFGGDTAIGGALDVSGDAEFSGDTTIGGNLAVTGTLSLPAGIIDNDALSAPVEFGRSGAGQTGFSIGTSATRVAIRTVSVPAGYSRALVMAFGGVSALATLGGWLYVGVQIGSVTPNHMRATATTSTAASITSSATRELTDLSGGTIEAAVSVYQANGEWTSTQANCDLFVVFLR